MGYKPPKVDTWRRRGDGGRRWAVRGFVDRSQVAVVLVGEGATQDGQSELEPLDHELSFGLIDAPRDFWGRTDRFDPWIELGLGLEDRSRLRRPRGSP